jgi:hypothetical protein
MRRLLRALLRWLASYSEAEKLARVAQRHAIEQETSGRVWPFEG